MLLADASAPACASAAAPAPLLSVPAASTGVRLVDLLFSSTGDAPGLVFLDWRATAAAPAGLWDVSWRLYHAAADLFIVTGPGAGVYWEEGWGWVADHDVNTNANLQVLNPRGMTVTGSGPSFLYGTAMEHSVLYQYNFSGTGVVTTIVTQTESEYFSVPPTGWAMVHNNAAVQMYGAGFYNWLCVPRDLSTCPPAPATATLTTQHPNRPTTLRRQRREPDGAVDGDELDGQRIPH